MTTNEHHVAVAQAAQRFTAAQQQLGVARTQLYDTMREANRAGQLRPVDAATLTGLSRQMVHRILAAPAGGGQD